MTRWKFPMRYCYGRIRPTGIISGRADRKRHQVFNCEHNVAQVGGRKCSNHIHQSRSFSKAPKAHLKLREFSDGHSQPVRVFGPGQAAVHIVKLFFQRAVHILIPNGHAQGENPAAVALGRDEVSEAGFNLTPEQRQTRASPRSQDGLRRREGTAVLHEALRSTHQSGNLSWTLS